MDNLDWMFTLVMVLSVVGIPVGIMVQNLRSKLENEIDRVDCFVETLHEHVGPTLTNQVVIEVNEKMAKK